MFSISLKQKFPILNQFAGKATCCYEDSGPKFGSETLRTYYCTWGGKFYGSANYDLEY